MNPEKKETGWSFFSKTLTALAALITAITGLIIALHTLGSLEQAKPKPEPSLASISDDFNSSIDLKKTTSVSPDTLTLEPEASRITNGKIQNAAIVKKLSLSLRQNIINNSIIPSKGIAGIAIGDHETNVINRIGEPNFDEMMIIYKDGGLSHYSLQYEEQELFLSVGIHPANKLVKGIRFRDESFNKNKLLPLINNGVTIGSSRKRLLRTFGPPNSSFKSNGCLPFPPDYNLTTFNYDGIQFHICDDNDLIFMIDIN